MIQSLNVKQLLVLSSAKGTAVTSTFSNQVSISYVRQSKRFAEDATQHSSGTSHLIRQYVDKLWAADWDNEDDAVYDR